MCSNLNSLRDFSVSSEQYHAHHQKQSTLLLFDRHPIQMEIKPEVLNIKPLDTPTRIQNMKHFRCLILFLQYLWSTSSMFLNFTIFEGNFWHKYTFILLEGVMICLHYCPKWMAWFQEKLFEIRKQYGIMDTDYREPHIYS